jgi:hypothetical protein
MSTEYEALRTGRISSLQFSTIAGLSDALIKARIAASLARLTEIADALGLQIHGTIELPAPGSRAA